MTGCPIIRHAATFLAVAAVFLSAPSAAAAPEGPPITTIQVEATGPVDVVAVAQVLELQIGRPIDRTRLREVIRTLYAGGEIEWLRVESAPSPDGVDVVVRISYRSTISHIKVRAKNPVFRVKVRRWLQLEVGDPVTAAGIETGRRRVERRLNDRGYTDAVVEAYLHYDREANTVAVEVEIDTGPADVINAVELAGIDDDEVIAAATPKFKPGARLTSKLEDRLRVRTETQLREMGFWEAEVVAVERHANGAGVEVLLKVDPGPRYRLELEAAPESMKIARAAFPNPAEEEVHPAQTEALAEQVQEHLQQAGYLLAEVRATLTDEDGGQVLRLEVDPGRKLKVAEVEFPGAESVRRSELEAAVTVKRGGVGGRFKQKIDNATLESDRQSLENFFHRQGFPFAVLSPPELVPVDGENSVRVLFPVDEGLRWIIDEVRVEELPVEAAAELESNPLDLAEGSPWSPGAVEGAKRRLEDALADSGYPEGRVEAIVDTSVQGKAAVTFTITSGPFVRVGDVIIVGLRHTHENLVAGVVRRAGVSTGEPLSRRKLLAAQRGLFELGLFRRAELVPMPGQEHRSERNIVVRCEEGEQKSYLFGVGYSNVDAARLILGWSHLNLLGRAYGFSAEVSLSQHQQQYSLSLRKRRAFGLPVPGYLAVYRTDEVLADRDLLRRGLWIDFGDRLKRPLRPWFRYEYEIIQPENLPIEPQAQLPSEFEESKVASITPSIEWDTRDNPLAPVTGVFASASAQYAFPAFLADEHFLKLQIGATVYKPIWRGFGAVGLRLGVIEPLYHEPDIPQNLQIPFAYRFFAGGRTTQRAFNTDDLGIPGQTIIDGNPIGGNAIILFNVEYRRRIAGEFFAAVFVDAGNVWASPSQVALGDIRWGSGLGLQYRTPAGPLRAEYAWKIDPLPGESRGQFFISFGVPF